MSRCRSCDKILNDYEMTRKSAVTGEYFDLCNGCFSTIKDQVYSKERADLLTESDSYETDMEFVDNFDKDSLTDWQ